MKYYSALIIFSMSSLFISCKEKKETVSLDSLRKETDSNYVQQDARKLNNDLYELTTWTYFNNSVVNTKIDTISLLNDSTQDNRKLEGQAIIKRHKLKK